MSTDSDWTVLPTGIGRVVTAMVTPFTADGSIDLDGAATLARHLVDSGSQTILVNGTTGESPTLTADEAGEVLAAVRDAVVGDATVMMGTGTNATRSTVAATERATAAGADAIMVVTPYYNRPDQRGLAEHFRAAADATDRPVVLYDIPFRTGREIARETLVELAAVENIVGVKDATADLGKVADVLAATHGADGGFGVWCGADEVNLPVLAVGGHGVISVSAHLAGPEIAAMIRVFPSDPARARELHQRCLHLHRALFAEPSPAPLKGALAALGLPGGPVRAPMYAASPDVVARVLDAHRALVDAR
ncbi:MAG: 4-hydroxy-tetrahydrodipicolinate synthase [Nitriliruptoraceae bacterium]